MWGAGSGSTGEEEPGCVAPPTTTLGTEPDPGAWGQVSVQCSEAGDREE